MSRSSNRVKMSDGAQIRKWNGARTSYKCADRVNVSVSNKNVRRDDVTARNKIKHINVIAYETCARNGKARVFISETEFSRDMVQIARGAKNSKTATFPSTIRKVSNDAFEYTAILSAVLNEGLETLGKYKSGGYEGVFRDTRLNCVALSSTLQALGDCAFFDCERLRKVTLKEGSKLKCIGGYAFYGCRRLRRIALPEGLETILDSAFRCSGL